MGCLCAKQTKYDAVAVPKIDASRCGPDVQLGVNNRLSGRGAALCNTTVLQDRMYFETKIVSAEGTAVPVLPQCHPAERTLSSRQLARPAYRRRH